MPSPSHWPWNWVTETTGQETKEIITSLSLVVIWFVNEFIHSSCLLCRVTGKAGKHPVQMASPLQGNSDINTCTHTYKQFNVSTSSDLHVFGLWRELNSHIEYPSGSVMTWTGDLLTETTEIPTEPHGLSCWHNYWGECRQWMTAFGWQQNWTVHMNTPLIPH